MKNPLEKKTNNLLTPILLGAAAAGAITYFLLSEDTAELRGKLADNLGKEWDVLKEKLPISAEDFTVLKDKFLEGVSSGFNSATTAGEKVKEIAS